MARRAKRRTSGDSYEDVKYQINVREGNRLAPVLRDLIGTEDLLIQEQVYFLLLH